MSRNIKIALLIIASFIFAFFVRTPRDAVIISTVITMVVIIESQQKKRKRNRANTEWLVRWNELTVSYNFFNNHTLIVMNDKEVMYRGKIEKAVLKKDKGRNLIHVEMRSEPNVLYAAVGTSGKSIHKGCRSTYVIEPLMIPVEVTHRRIDFVDANNFLVTIHKP